MVLNDKVFILVYSVAGRGKVVKSRGMREKGRGRKELLYGIGAIAAVSLIGFLSGGAVTGYQVAQTPLNNAIEFLRGFGFFNVVLPFLLVFTIVFGILEKTRIFGTEKVKGKDEPRRNLDAMVAFVIAFFVVAASNIVQAIQVSLPMISLFLIVIIAFLLLVGIFFGEGEFSLYQKFPTFTKVIIGVIVLALLAVFLNAFGFLSPITNFFLGGASGTLGASVIFVVIIIAALWYIAGGKKEAKE